MIKRYTLIFAFLIVFIGLIIVGLSTDSVFANHSWGGYHWARTANPFTLKLGDNVSSIWDNSLALASSDWSLSSVLDTTIVSGLANPKNCRATKGRVEICNGKYGKNGWLGTASVWVNGDHITQGTVKLNDTYFNTTKYNTSPWRQIVMCQEIAHTFGLDHQDENFTNQNLGTCMDYTNNPSTNQHPNLHDYEMLETIYAHLDSLTTLLSQVSPASISQIDGNDPSSWGRAIKESHNSHSSLYERDLGHGQKIFTFVIWAD